MPVVPFTPNVGAPQPEAPQPPEEPWALMAAAQMHAEGRLVEKEPNDQPAE